MTDEEYETRNAPNDVISRTIEAAPEMAELLQRWVDLAYDGGKFPVAETEALLSRIRGEA